MQLLTFTSKDGYQLSLNTLNIVGFFNSATGMKVRTTDGKEIEIKEDSTALNAKLQSLKK